MKNLFLMLAFMLAGTFAFAGTGELEIVKHNGFLEKSAEIIEEGAACIHVTHSCGVEYDICNFRGTTMQLVMMVWLRDEIICD